VSGPIKFAACQREERVWTGQRHGFIIHLDFFPKWFGRFYLV